MDYILEKALLSLTTTCNKTALHPNDEDRIKVTLRTLYTNDIVLNSTEIERWLVSNNWKSSPVKQIIIWVRKISSGGQVKIKDNNFSLTEQEVWTRLNA